MGLHGGHQGVARLVVGHDLLLLVGEDPALFLVAGDDHLHALLQVLLGGVLPPRPHRPEGGLVDDVGQLRAGGPGGRLGDGLKVHVLRQADLLGVDLQDVDAALEVGELHGDAPVKAARPQQGGVQGVGAVGGCQHHHALGAVKAVHLGEQLIQGLLPLVVAGELAVPLLADGVDLVNEHNAGGLLVGLLEQVPHLGRAPAHEHLHKLRAGDGEEGHVGLAGHRLGQQGLAGARRAHQQGALGQLGADGAVLLRVVEEVHDLAQEFLGLVLPGHVGKADAGGGGHVHLGPGIAAHAEHHAVAAPHGVLHPLVQEIADDQEGQEGQNPAQQDIEQRIGLAAGVDAAQLAAVLVHPVHQVHVAGDGHRLVEILLGLVGEDDLVRINLNQSDVVVIGHGHEGGVVHLLHRSLPHHGKQRGVQQHDDQNDDHIVEDQRFFGGLLQLLHTYQSFILRDGNLRMPLTG